jgi:hypothetical protein
VPLPRSFSTGLQPGATIEYYADVVDADGAVLQHLGSVALPFSAQVERPAGASLVRRWWFWTATAAVVAAAATGIGLGTYYSQPQVTRGMVYFEQVR